jgi:hypothetical protein
MCFYFLLFELFMGRIYEPKFTHTNNACFAFTNLLYMTLLLIFLLLYLLLVKWLLLMSPTVPLIEPYFCSSQLDKDLIKFNKILN